MIYECTWHALSSEDGVSKLAAVTAMAEWKSMFIVFPRGFEHLGLGRLEQFPLARTGGLQHRRDVLKEWDQLLRRRFVWFSAVFHLLNRDINIMDLSGILIYNP